MSRVINEQRIEKAFAKAIANTNRRIKAGMEHLLEWGMQECLRCHDERHRNHFDMGDGYAWALFKDKTIVSERIWEGGYNIDKTNIKSVRDCLHKFVPKTKGWVGVVMASMQPRAYFVVRFEESFMRTAMGNMESLNFDEIFKSA